MSSDPIAPGHKELYGRKVANVKHFTLALNKMAALGGSCVPPVGVGQGGKRAR